MLSTECVVFQPKEDTYRDRDCRTDRWKTRMNSRKHKNKSINARRLFVYWFQLFGFFLRYFQKREATKFGSKGSKTRSEFSQRALFRCFSTENPPIKSNQSWSQIQELLEGSNNVLIEIGRPQWFWSYCLIRRKRASPRFNVDCKQTLCESSLKY